MRWEYRIEPFERPDKLEERDELVHNLNELGRQGWELVHTTTDDGVGLALFKRPAELP